MFATLKESGKDLLFFLKNPTDQTAPGQDLSQKIRQLFALLAISMGVVLLIDFPLMYLIEISGFIDMDGHAVGKAVEEMPVGLLLLTTCILAPILEEIIFRTFITYKRNYPLKLLISIGGLGGKRSKVRLRRLIIRNWRNYYNFLFFSAALLFAFIHIANFESSVNVWLLSPILVLPQFLAGLIFGYIRVRQGLIWSMFLHSSHNFILIGSAILFMGMATEKLDVETQAYKIHIEESALKSPEKSSLSSFSMGQSTVTFKRTRLQDILQYLLDQDEQLLKFNKQDKADLLLNISFTQWSDTLNRKKVILNHLLEVYEFKINRKDSLLQFFALQLSDSLLLQSHLTILPDSVKTFNATFRSQEKKLILKNANTESLAHHLSKNSSLYFVFEKRLAGTYDIELPLNSTEELKTALLDKYGISMVAGEKMATNIMIEF